jgi:hypothetical protein
MPYTAIDEKRHFHKRIREAFENNFGQLKKKTKNKTTDFIFIIQARGGETG